MNKSLSLLIAGIAAYGYYKYTKMTDAQKSNLVSGLKDKGRKILDQYVPSDLKDKLNKIS